MYLLNVTFVDKSDSNGAILSKLNDRVSVAVVVFVKIFLVCAPYEEAAYRLSLYTSNASYCEAE